LRECTERVAERAVDVDRPLDPDEGAVEPADRIRDRRQLLEHPRPALACVGEAEPRVHDDPPAARGRKEVAVHVIDPQREGERHASDSGVQFQHFPL
jgi:hypothetical protein